MDKAEAGHFVEKYRAGNYTTSEHQAFHEWLLSKPLAETQALLEEYAGLLQQSREHISADPHLLERIEERISARPTPVRPLSSFKRRPLYVAAAVIAVMIVAGIYWTLKPERLAAPAATIVKEAKHDIPAGENKALLTLADGLTITLHEASKGILARQGHTKVVKLNNGQLAYKPGNTTDGPGSSDVLYNTVETPRGGQYQLVLPDGTKVWLNAASSLRYPASFTGPDRTVFLNGEAYFEVAPSTLSGSTSKKPFHVEVNEMKVSVLGTHFNIMAYANESHIQTTLLEGSVRVSSELNTQNPVLLYPGQQASLNKATANLKVREMDVEEAIAWQKGYFLFKRADVYTIMRRIARWYDVEVIYEGDMPKDEFVGKISRDEPLSRVLKIFELSNIRFRIEGRKIIVMP